MLAADPLHDLELEWHESVEPVVDAWDRLADELAATPFARPGWLTAWAVAFAPGQLRALTVTRGGELVGLLPVIRHRGVVQAPVNWHTPSFGVLATDDSVRAAIATACLGQAAARVDVSHLDGGDPLLANLRAAAVAAGRTAHVRPVLQSPYVSVAGRGWDDYLATINRKARKEIMRLRRRLEELGAVSFEFNADPSDLGARLQEGFRLEASDWKREQGTAILSDPRIHRFYADVARWAGDRGWLRLAFLRVSGRAIAFDLCLQTEGVVYVLKGGFDPEFRRFGPGMLLTFESLRETFGQGMESYELLGDDDPYKLTWTTTVRERVRFQAFSSSVRGRLSRLAWTHGRNIARRLRGAERARTGHATHAAQSGGGTE